MFSETSATSEMNLLASTIAPAHFDKSIEQIISLNDHKDIQTLKF